MKRIIVTGATSGIGEEVAYQLGRAGTALVLRCRDVAKGERVAARILAEGGTLPPAPPRGGGAGRGGN